MYLLNEMIKWYKNQYNLDFNINTLASSEDVALFIAKYAHRGQKRCNGDSYISHPMAVSRKYKELFNVMNEDDIKLLNELKIPCAGVIETCLLHDVLEDTDFSLSNIRNIFKYFGYEELFNLNINDNLLTITKTNVNYQDYVNKIIDNPIASLVKMLDILDNLNLFSLLELNDSNYERNIKYISCFYLINKKYKYVEKANIYQQRRKKI